MLKALLLISIYSLIAKIILTYFLVDKIFQNGLALSTSIGYIFLCIGCLAAVSSLKLQSMRVFFNKLFYYSINGFLCLSIVFIIEKQIPAEGELGILLEISLFIFMFLLNCFIVKDDSIFLFHNSIKDLIGGRTIKEKDRTSAI